MSTAPETQPSQRPNRKSGNRKRRNTKRTGERSEAAFLHKANDLGFVVAKPWGDSERYDFIVGNGSCFYRIQIKCTNSLRAQAYETRATYTVGKRRAVYTRRDIDFLIAHVVPLDVWYIVPVNECTPAPMLRFYPHRKAKRMRLEKYREAWHLLESRNEGSLTIQAVAEEPCTAPVGRTLLSDNFDILQETCHSERAKGAEGEPAVTPLN